MKKPEKVSSKRHHDDQYVDEIRIEVHPRYKESELSGDEWRVAAQMIFLRKGHVVWTKTFSNVDAAASALPWFWKVAMEGEDFKRLPDEIDRKLCAQPGCSKPATKSFRIKQEQLGNTYAMRIPTTPIGTQFCDQHADRGDAGLEDQDSNLEPVETPST